jgi:hypothetical protein
MVDVRSGEDEAQRPPAKVTAGRPQLEWRVEFPDEEST